MWKHQLPSIFCRHQPTGGSNLSQLQLTYIKLQLYREAPTSLLFQKRNTCWFTLDISSVLFHLLWCSSILISALYHLCIFSDSLLASPSSLINSSFSAQLLFLLYLTASFLHSLHSLSNLLVHINVILYIEFITWLFTFLRKFEVNSPDFFLLPSHFFYPLIQRNITICINFNITVGVLFSYWRLANASQTIKKNLIATFTFTFLVTHFNFTQLLFWIFGFTGFGFSAAVK